MNFIIIITINIATVLSIKRLADIIYRYQHTNTYFPHRFLEAICYKSCAQCEA